MPEPLTRVPREIVRLSTPAWRFENPEFAPADGWTLEYFFEGPSELNIVAVADGAGHLVELTALQTAIATGSYAWQAIASRVTPTLERVLVATGRTEFLLNFGTDTTTGPQKSHAARMVEAIEAQLEGRATDGQRAMSINGRSLDRIPVLELMEIRAKYRMELRSEESALAQGATPGKRRRIKVRF